MRKVGEDEGRILDDGSLLELEGVVEHLSVVPVVSLLQLEQTGDG